MQGQRFPQPREVLRELTDGREFAGHVVTTVFQEQADAYGAHDPVPQLLVFETSVVEGFLDRVTQVQLALYAEGPSAALQVLEAILAEVCGVGITTSAGYIDSISVVQGATEAPYTERLNRGSALLQVVSRPI